MSQGGEEIGIRDVADVGVDDIISVELSPTTSIPRQRLAGSGVLDRGSAMTVLV